MSQQSDKDKDFSIDKDQDQNLAVSDKVNDFHVKTRPRLHVGP